MCCSKVLTQRFKKFILWLLILILPPPPPTMSDIAKIVGCSKNTVSLALRNSPLISIKTKRKIVAVSKRLGYVRNDAFSRFMSEIKLSGLKRYRETIALVNANENPSAFKNHPTIPKYVEGIRRAAQREGFAINEFWLYDPGLSARSFERILKTRNIRGGIITGLMNEKHLPKKFGEIWNKFCFVITGVRTYGPTLNFTIADHFLIAYQATMQALRHGYNRPALVLDREIDELIEGRFTGGFLRAQLSMPQSDKIEPFFDVKQSCKDRSIFRRWFFKNKPNALICLYNSARLWVEELGFKVPDDIALIQLERRENEPEWAGLDQRNDLAGEAAVGKLSQLLYSSNSDSSKREITATLVSPEWVESSTICMQSS